VRTMVQRAYNGRTCAQRRDAAAGGAGRLRGAHWLPEHHDEAQLRPAARGALLSARPRPPRARSARGVRDASDLRVPGTEALSRAAAPGEWRYVGVASTYRCEGPARAASAGSRHAA